MGTVASYCFGVCSGVLRLVWRCLVLEQHRAVSDAALRELVERPFHGAARAERHAAWMFQDAAHGIVRWHDTYARQLFFFGDSLQPSALRGIASRVRVGRRC